MPIRAENRDRYPADWPQISRRWTWGGWDEQEERA
jgi:hypothetical protein